MPRGLEFLDWAGITDGFERIGLRRFAHEFRTPRGLLLAVRYDRLPHAHPYTLMIPQHHSERLLQEAATATGLVEIRRGHRVVDAGQRPGAAVLTVDGPDGRYVEQATWAVGADGAHSTVRRRLGITQRWRDYGMDSAVADFEMTSELPPERSRIVLDPRRPYGFFAFAPGRWRLVYRLNPGEDRHAMTTEAAATALLRQKAPGADVHRFLWASAFRLGQGQSATYRHGRWLLVGDAAHAMGPSAGAGMMIGVLGAWRLGHHLAETVAGGSDKPLDRYEDEQRAAATEVQHDNARIFANMAVRSRPLAAVRGAVLRTAGRLPAVTARMARSEALLHLGPVPEDPAMAPAPSGATRP
jgi:2-polyprenyl-6-methoxyphenol hydroxylase-like FAD-dependent oxidoreductase